MAKGAFYTVLNDAIRDFSAHGFDSQARLDKWLSAIEAAANAIAMPRALLQRRIADHLRQVFNKQVTRPGALAQRHPGVPDFKLRQIVPRLHGELDRRILSSVSLITLNRKVSREQALKRFVGWSTSIPIGGSRAVDKKETADAVYRSIAGIKFEDRRVIIDQGHKLVASIHEIVAQDLGAIALRWHHTKKKLPEYDARPDHVARDDKIFVIRGNWAIKEGLMKQDGRPFYDEVTAVGEEPYCECWAEYLYTLRDLPDSMVSAKGQAALSHVRSLIKQRSA